MLMLTLKLVCRAKQRFGVVVDGFQRGPCGRALSNPQTRGFAAIPSGDLWSHRPTTYCRRQHDYTPVTASCNLNRSNTSLSPRSCLLVQCSRSLCHQDHEVQYKCGRWTLPIIPVSGGSTAAKHHRTRCCSTLTVSNRSLGEITTTSAR